MPAFSSRGASTWQDLAFLFVCLISIVTNSRRAAHEYSPHSGHIGLMQSGQRSGQTRFGRAGEDASLSGIREDVYG